ncbi:hypothetical protein PCANC_28717 [Puccinia coronata f. sp. avenae]|uniref:Uncharacterized protein n=1 Tax=Puccinia coronata f. sp. avenae TaxID=200324 RepID=A0A2N5TPZ4_9BASI|nr:hypothetical protein PCANC_28717 [Puccinia coronata f. sp. avenae]
MAFALNTHLTHLNWATDATQASLAAKARSTNLSDSSIRTSLASEKSQLLPQQKVWKGAPRAPFPV